MGRIEAPGAGPDEDLGARRAELLDGGGDGVRAEQAAAPLVGVERRADVRVQRIRRGQGDATDDGEGEQQRTPRAGAEHPDQLVRGQQVEQRRGGDEARAGEIVRRQPGDVGPSSPRP